MLGSEMASLTWCLFGLFITQTLVMASGYLLVRHLLDANRSSIQLAARALSVVLSATAAFVLCSGLPV